MGGFSRLAAALAEEAPYQAHSATSRAAARSIRGGTQQLHLAIIGHLKVSDGATDEEMQDALEMAPNTQRPRRRELELQGVVEDSGRTRATRSGRKAILWRLTNPEKY